MAGALASLQRSVVAAKNAAEAGTVTLEAVDALLLALTPWKLTDPVLLAHTGPVLAVLDAGRVSNLGAIQFQGGDVRYWVEYVRTHGEVAQPAGVPDPKQIAVALGTIRTFVAPADVEAFAPLERQLLELGRLAERAAGVFGLPALAPHLPRLAELFPTGLGRLTRLWVGNAIAEHRGDARALALVEAALEAAPRCRYPGELRKDCASWKKRLAADPA